MKKTLGMVVLMIAAMGVVGCSDSHEKVVKDQLELLEKLLGVLEGVTDEESAEAAKSELESIRAEDELIDARLKELGQLKRGEKRELEEEYGQATEDALGDLQDQSQRLGKMRDVRRILGLWNTLEPVLSELSLTDMAAKIAKIAEIRNDVAVSACRSNQKAIETAAAMYRLKENRNPTDMTDLVNAEYLPEAPRCSEGGAYAVDGTCTVHSAD